MKNVKPGHTRPIVCIDAGHYGLYNRSPVAPEYYESTMTWALAFLLDTQLSLYGIEVRHTRADPDKDMALTARGQASQGADLFLSLHSNAAGDASVRYVLALHMVDDNCGAMDEQSAELARLLAEAVGFVMDLPWKMWSVKSSSDRDGNGYKDDYYGVLRGAHSVGTPGVIIEHGFHTHAETAEWLMVEENLEKLAKAEAAKIAQYFDVEMAEDTPTGQDVLYRVRKSWEDTASQIGAFNILDNAILACEQGYTVYDWNGTAVFENKPTKEVYEMKMRILREGCLGEDVKALQILLKGRGYQCGTYGPNSDGVDGDYGKATGDAVEAYQQANGLPDDREAGPVTMGSLLGVS